MALYAVRLLWNGRLGMAKHGGYIAEFTRWPPALLPGLHITEMEYTPEVRDYRVRESANAWRELLPAERAEIKAWLEGMAACGRDYIEREREPADGL